ncbi:MAG: superoxide dismutase [Steroidobacteraceae bacterium]
MKVAQPQIPYSFRELEPAMSRETLWFHFSRHQYVSFEAAKAIISNTPLDGLELEEIIVRTARVPAQAKLFQFLSGLWNHHMFWRSMRRGGGGAPSGPVGNLIRREFGSYQDFIWKFKQVAAGFQGSGWMWLTWVHGDLQIETTVNSESPLLDGHIVLLALDMWEHAYYLDHQNRRREYVRTFLEELVDWDFANCNLVQAVMAASSRPVPAISMGV